MTTASDEFWHDYLRQDKKELRREAVQQKLLKENASLFVAVSEKEREDLSNILLTCSSEIKIWLAPMVEIPEAHHLLYAVLLEEKQKSNNNEEETKQRFQTRLETDVSLINKLNAALDALDESASTYEAVQKCATAPPPNRESLKTIIAQRKERTWRDVPENELAERLAKGEIIPRDEWIPGLSEGRRKLKKVQLEAHLAFGYQLRNEGNNAYAQQDFNTALTRYSQVFNSVCQEQGVNLLNWVEGEITDDTKLVDDLLLTFLKNQSAAALKLGDYRIAQEATTTALALDEHDAKSRFRRAKAFVALGEIVPAKNDYMFILKSAYTTTDDHMAARQGLQEIRGIVTKWKSNMKSLINSVSEAGAFSSNRLSTPRKKVLSPEIQGRFQKPIMPIKPPAPVMVPDITSEPTISKEKLSEILHDILESDEVQKKLNDVRRQADFEEHKVLIRGRKLIPEMISHVLSQHNVPGYDFKAMKSNVDKSVQYWRTRDQHIKEFAEAIYKAFLGDVLDDELVMETVKKRTWQSDDKATVLRKTNQKICALGNEKKLGEALRLFRQLLEKRIHPNIITYTSLINAFVRSNEIKKALSIFHALIDSKKYSKTRLSEWFHPKYRITPNIVTYTTILKGLCNNFLMHSVWYILLPLIKNTIRENEPASKKLKLDDENNCQPSNKVSQLSVTEVNVRCINTVLRGCVRCGDLVTAWVIYKLINSKEDILLDSQSILYIVKILCTAQRIDEAYVLVKNLKRRSIKNNDIDAPNSSTTNGQVSDIHILADSYTELAISHALRTEFDVTKKYLKKARKIMKITKTDDDNNKFMNHKDNERNLLITQVSSICENKIAESSITPAFEKLFYIRPDESFVPSDELINILCEFNIPYKNDAILNDLLPANDTTSEIIDKYTHSALTFGISHFTTDSKSKHSQIKKIKKFYRSIIDTKENKIKLDEVFKNSSTSFRLEIGTGTGDWILAQAQKHQNINWVAMEIRHDRVYHLFAELSLKNVSNLAIFGGDASNIIKNNLDSERFEKIYINFPEPPPYYDHPDHFLCRQFFESLHTILRHKGKIFIVTDNIPYVTTISNSVKTLSHLYQRQCLHEGLPLGFTAESSYFERLWTNGSKTSRAYLELQKL